MPNDAVRIEMDATGRWAFLDPTTLAKSSFNSRDVAIEELTQRLRSDTGGRVHVVAPDGRVLQTTDVESDRKERLASLEERAQPVEEMVDQMAGRGHTSPPTVEGSLQEKIEDLDVARLVPSSIRSKPLFRTINAHMSLGAAAATAVGFLFGGGALGGFVTQLTSAALGKASVGSYISYGQSFIAAFAMCVALTVTVFAWRVGQETGTGVSLYSLAFAFVITSLLAAAAANNIGLPSPSAADFQAMHPFGSTPPGQVANAFVVFLLSYGPAPFITGLIIGPLSGNLAWEIKKQTA